MGVIKAESEINIAEMSNVSSFFESTTVIVFIGGINRPRRWFWGDVLSTSC
jgi:hypothetical protein